ncbi:hypothetical protein AcW1_001389 [Taiwanofungus camphoratus]|nr:hypothetical protein AcW1_001389 [Antrodia cinnamomea]
MYAGVNAQSASSQTAYRWSFATKTSRADNEALRAARDEVGAATYNLTSGLSGSARVQGPTLPSQSDLVLARETADEYRAADRDSKRKLEKREAKERIEEMVGPKEVGREGMLEKKRVQRESDRTFREKGDDGFELDDSTLMGGGDSFKERCACIVVTSALRLHCSSQSSFRVLRIARREAARRRFEEKRFGAREERMAATRERADAIRQKDKATMDMFMQIAKDKFG